MDREKMINEIVDYLKTVSIVVVEILYETLQRIKEDENEQQI